MPYHFDFDRANKILRAKFDGHVDDEEMRTIREMASYKPVVSAIPVFIVAPAPHIFRTSRMFQIQGSRTRPMLQVVQSMDEVYTQLNVKKAKFKSLKED